MSRGGRQTRLQSLKPEQSNGFKWLKSALSQCQSTVPEDVSFPARLTLQVVTATWPEAGCIFVQLWVWVLLRG